MLTPDDQGRVWHPGTKLGILYSIALAVFLLLTGVIPQEVPALQWLEKLQALAIFAPMAAASHAYVLGRRPTKTGSIPNS